MSETTDLLIPVESSGDNELQMFKEMSKSGDYLPRVQICGGNSAVVLKGHAQVGNIAIVTDADNVEDIGKQLDFIPIDWRPMAMRISEANGIFQYFNPETDAFKQVQAESAIQDSECMYGPQFLIYIPFKDTFATYYMSSKTSRKKSKQVLDLRGRHATLRPVLIESGKNKWFGPTITPCSTPPIQLPDEDKLALEKKKWAIRIDSTAEKAKAPAEDERVR